MLITTFLLSNYTPRYGSPSLYRARGIYLPVPEMQAVEVATIKIKAGSNVFDRGSEAARIWRGMLDTISRQKGCQTLYSGQEHESPNIVQLLVGMHYQAPISTKSR